VSTFSLYGAHVVVWTMDGPALNKLCFVAGLEDNSLDPRRPPGEPPEPRFRAEHEPTEVMELFEAAYSRPTGTPVIFKTANLRPAKFAGSTASASTSTSSTRWTKSSARASRRAPIHKGKLYLVFYHGARIHYFGKNLPEVESIIGRRASRSGGLSEALQRP
jgi:hypothetical protein